MAVDPKPPPAKKQAAAAEASAVDKARAFFRRSSTSGREAGTLGLSSASSAVSSAATSASKSATAASTFFSDKAKALSAPMGKQPKRVGFVGVARDRKLVVWARDGGDLGPHTATLSQRYSALGRKLAERDPPPGWDDLTESDARPVDKGGGAMRGIALPVCDFDGTTCYVVCFGYAYPLAKAQVLCERLALMLGPLVDEELARDPTTKKAAVSAAGCAALCEVLEREIAKANEGSALAALNNQVEEVRAIMERNVEMILDRGEKLDELQGKSDNLAKASAVFRKQARSLKRWHLMNQVRWGVAVGTLVTASIAIPIAILVAA